MKAIISAVIFTSLFASQAFAECKSVMGTCVNQELVNSAPHMHSEYVDKTKVKAAPVAATKPSVTSTAKNNKNTAKKTNSTGVFSTMQKAVN